MPREPNRQIMIITNKEVLKDLKSKNISVDMLATHLLRHYPAVDIARELAQKLIDEETPNRVNPVVITAEQFETFFRVSGYRLVNGELAKETRGRFRKENM